MLRRILIILLAIIVGFGSIITLYPDEIGTMISMIQNYGQEEQPDGPSSDSKLEVVEVQIDASEAKTVFAFAEEFTTDGLKITVKFSDGSTKQVSPEECKISKVDTSKPGTRQVVVTYEGVTARYEITINKKVYAPISPDSLVDITEENDSIPYRVEAELIDMVTPGVVLADGYEGFVAVAPEGAAITSGEQYLTGFGVSWNYFGFTFTAAEQYENVTLVLRVANSTAKDINAGVIRMFLNLTQDELGSAIGELPLDGYIIEAQGECNWSDIVIRNLTIPAGTNTLTFEVQGKDSAFDIDYVDFYVGMRYISSVVEIQDTTTIIRDLESLDTEKAFTRQDVANAHGLKDGQLFVEPTKESPGKTTNGGKAVGAIGKGSQMSTTIRLGQDATVLIKFKASSVGHGAYAVNDHWNFYIDGVKLSTVEEKNIEGGNKDKGEWWDWIYTDIGIINLSAGDHFFLIEVVGTDCNVDTVEFEIVSFGSFDESGTNLEDMEKPAPEPIVSTTIDKEGTYVFEAEDLSTSNLKPSDGWEDRGVQIETPSSPTPATSGGKSIGACGGGYTTVTFTLKEQATIQVYGRIAHANGGAASNFMSMKLGDTDLVASGDLPKGDSATSQYWNWADIAFGAPMTLEAGQYTLTVNFLKNPNFDCVKIDVLSYGEVKVFATIEAETFDNEGVVTRQDMIDAGRIPAGEYMSESGNGATCICGFTSGTWFKFNFNVEEAMTLEMFLVGATDSGNYDVSTKLSVTVNGTAVEIPSGLLTGSGSTPYWDWQTVSLGIISLNAGDNEIVLTILSGHPNLDKVFFLESDGEITVPEHECESVCAKCGKCTDSECTEAACASKCEGHVVTPDIVITDANNEYKVEAEELDMSTLVPQAGFTNPVVESFDGGKGLGGIGGGGYQSFVVTTDKDVSVNLYISFANAGGGSILNFIPAIYLNGEALSLLDGQIPAGIGSPQESVSNFYWNVANVHIATFELKAGETYTIKIMVNQGNLDGYALSVNEVAHVHTEVAVDAVAPTCTATGLTAGVVCSACGEVLVAQETVNALGHTEAIDKAVDATCTATGLTEGKHCSVCNEVLVAQETINALGHTEAIDKAVDATCTATGLTEGKHCSVCGTVIVAQTETPMIAHSYDDKYDESCNACGFIRDAECAHLESVLVPGTAATCTAAGLTDGYNCKKCGEILTAQQTIPELGHTEKVDTAVDATCTATGLTEGKSCSVCGEVLVAQETVDALGHTEAVDKGVDATCTASGLTEGKHCSVCNEVLVAQETIDALGHSEVVDAAVNATSVKPGLTEGKHCSVCGETLVAQQEIPVITLTINGAGEYVFEGENLEMSTLTPSAGQTGVMVEYPNQQQPVTSGGASLGAAGGGYTTFTFTLEQKATVQLYARLAQRNGIAPASSAMVVLLNSGILTLQGDLGGANENSTYFNWYDIAAGGAMDLEAGTYTVTIRLLKNPNIDCFKIDVLSYGSFVQPTKGDVVIDAPGRYTYEAENVETGYLVLRPDFIAVNKYTFTEDWSNDFGNGTCLMGFTNGSVVKLYVEVKEAGTLALSMRMSYASNAIFDFSGITYTFAGQTLTPTPEDEFGMRNNGDWWKWVEVSLGEVEVEAGIHLFEINFARMDNHNIESFKFTTVTEEALPCENVCEACGNCTSEICVHPDHAVKCTGHDVFIKGNEAYILEAENWDQTNMIPRPDLVAANHPALSGNRLLENSGTTIGGMAPGSYISFNVYVKEDSTVAFVMKAAHSEAFVISNALTLTIDGVEVELCNADIKGSGSAPWFDWSILTIGYANISAGEHTVVLKFDVLSCNIDYLKLDVMSYGSYADSELTIAKSGTTKFELENIDCKQSLINTRSDFVPAVGAGNCGKGSGRIYGYTDGSIFRFVVTVEEACTLEIKLAGFGGKALNQLQYFFGATEIIAPEGAKLGSGGTVAEGLIGTVSVEAGTYVFEFTSDGGTDLDYVSFTVVE